MGNNCIKANKETTSGPVSPTAEPRTVGSDNSSVNVSTTRPPPPRPASPPTTAPSPPTTPRTFSPPPTSPTGPPKSLRPSPGAAVSGGSNCPQCGTTLKPAAKFCGSCGSKAENSQNTAPPPRPKAAPTPAPKVPKAAPKPAPAVAPPRAPVANNAPAPRAPVKPVPSQDHAKEKREKEEKEKREKEQRERREREEKERREREEKERRDREEREKRDREEEKKKAQKSSPTVNSTGKPTSPKTGGVGNLWAKQMEEKAFAEKDAEREKIRGRRGKAVEFMDKQIRTIIGILKGNNWQMSFGELFQRTSDKMDALSAILNTAKKRGVLTYEAESALLMQGKDDHVIIKLLKDTMPDSQAHKSRAYDPKEVQAALNAPVGPEKCYVCSKTVYTTERIAPNNKAMHKACFKCFECQSKLRLDAYCLNNGSFFWYVYDILNMQ